MFDVGYTEQDVKQFAANIVLQYILRADFKATNAGAEKSLFFMELGKTSASRFKRFGKQSLDIKGQD